MNTATLEDYRLLYTSYFYVMTMKLQDPCNKIREA